MQSTPVASGKQNTDCNILTMENLPTDSDPSLRFSDEDDARLFRHDHCPLLANLAIPMKRNDPRVTSFELFAGGGAERMDGRLWRRLGCILGRNTRVERLGIGAWDADVEGLCAGLRHNRSIEKLWFAGVDFRGAAKMAGLAQFVSRSPSIKEISLFDCSLDAGCIDILSKSMMGRPYDVVDLRGSIVGDVKLDRLALALTKCKSVLLVRNGIGLDGCRSLAKLLEHPQIALARLYISENSIENDSAIALAKSLAKNTTLELMSLTGNNDITTAGWSAMLKLVCGNSSVDDAVSSNHTLHNLGMQIFARDRELVDRALGVDDANLLRASLERNRSSNKVLAARCKVLWGHARGNFNMAGDPSIAMGVIPRVLSWVGDENEPNASLVQYHEPPLPKEKTDCIRLDSVYRIVKSRPEIFMPKSRPGHDKDGKNLQKNILAASDEIKANFACVILFGVILSVLFRFVLMQAHMEW